MMPLGKDAYEKALGRTLSDAEYAKLTSVADPNGPQSRDPKAYVGAELANKNAGAALPKDATYAATQAWYGKHGDIAAGKPMAPPNVTYKVPGRLGEDKEIGLYGSTPAEVDAHVNAGNIDAATAASIKDHIKRTAIESGFSGQKKAGKATVGDEMSAKHTAETVQNKKADAAMAASLPQGEQMIGPLTGWASPPVAPKAAPLPQPSTNTSPYLPAAPAPTKVPGYASGMTVHEDEDEYGAVLANGRKKWGL